LLFSFSVFLIDFLSFFQIGETPSSVHFHHFCLSGKKENPVPFMLGQDRFYPAVPPGLMRIAHPLTHTFIC